MESLTYNCIFVVELLLLCNNMLIAIIIAQYEVLLVYNFINLLVNSFVEQLQFMSNYNLSDLNNQS